MAKVSEVKQVQNFYKKNKKSFQNIEGLEAGATAGTNFGFLERDYTEPRSAMIVTSKVWLAQNKYIVLWVNPREMGWTLGRREAISKTATGVVRNTWKNRVRGTYYDEPLLNITFQTGNILPGVTVPSSRFGTRVVESTPVATPNEQGVIVDRYEKVRNKRGPLQADPAAIADMIKAPPVPPGLENFYDFLGLIDQDVLAGSGENRHILLYRTRVFPRMRLEGYFQGELSFTESADNANRLTWSMAFQVYHSIPRFYHPSQLKAAYSDAVRTHALSDFLPKSFDFKKFDEGFTDEKDQYLSDPTTWNKKKIETDKGSGAQKKGNALVTPEGYTAAGWKKKIQKQNKQTSDNYQKQLESLSRVFNLGEPLKSKLLKYMSDLENQALADGSYVPRSVVDQQARAWLASNDPDGDGQL